MLLLSQPCPARLEFQVHPNLSQILPDGTGNLITKSMSFHVRNDTIAMLDEMFRIIQLAADFDISTSQPAQ